MEVHNSWILLKTSHSMANNTITPFQMNKDTVKYISEKTKEYRLKNKLTQKKVAFLAKIPLTTYQRVEHGTGVVPIKTLEAICEVFGCTSSEILPF